LPKQNVGNTTYMGTNIINCFTDISNIFWPENHIYVTEVLV